MGTYKQLHFQEKPKSKFTETVDLSICGQKLALRADDPQALANAATMTEARIEDYIKKCPTLSLQNAAILAALDLSCELLKQNREHATFRSEVSNKSKNLLDQLEARVLNTAVSDEGCEHPPQ